ncbi:MAG TPA: hypothetical protein VGK71_10130 [Nitrospirota bacterium]|jgi:hypothetical protein
MATKQQQMQKLFHHYKDITGKTDIDVHSKEFIDFAISKGWPLPKPTDPRDLLAQKFSSALRDEIKYDNKTKMPYRVNHCYAVKKGDKQIHFWIDIDEAPRKTMRKSAVMRRNQVVGDVLQLTLDLDHWNSVNPNEKPIYMPTDFTEDVEERKNAPVEKAG